VKFVGRCPWFSEWLQAMLAKGDGGRVIELAQAIEDWMAVCHQQESEVERLAIEVERLTTERDEAIRLMRRASNNMTADSPTWLAIAEFFARLVDKEGNQP
jgi:hypothetical protein